MFDAEGKKNKYFNDLQGTYWLQ